MNIIIIVYLVKYYDIYCLDPVTSIYTVLVWVSVYLFVSLPVCLYPINVKTAERLGQLLNVHCTVYNCTVFIVQCTLCSVHCTEYIVQYSLYSVHCTVFIVLVFIVQCLLFSVNCTVYIVQCTLYSVHCTVFIV